MVQQNFPSLDTPFVRDNKLIALPWYQLLVSLWLKAGSGFTPANDAVTLVSTPSGIEAFDAVTGVSLGFVTTTGGAPGPAVPVLVTASPQVYIAAAPGALVVFGAQSEWSRSAGLTWYTVSLTGAAIPVAKNDRVRFTWFSADLPRVTFFPAF